jgi:hypothetical protein
MSPTTRAAAAPEKARPRRRTVAATVGIKWPSPLPSKDDPRAARAPGSKNLTLEGCDYRPVVSKPAQRELAPHVPSIYKVYRSAVRGPARLRTLETRRCEKSGAPSCHPATALLIRGSKPDPRRVRTGAPDRQSQGQRGRAHSSLSSSPPARGRPICGVREPARAASRGDPIEGELPHPRSLANGTEPHLANLRKRFNGRVSGPRANPYRMGHGRPLEPPDSSSTRNPQSRPDRWGLWKPHPPSRGETAWARLKQDGEPAPIASNRPRLEGSTHGYTSWGAPNVRDTRRVRVTEAG